MPGTQVHRTLSIAADASQDLEWTPVAWLRLGAAGIVATHAVMYGIVVGHDHPAYVTPVALSLAAVLVAMGIYQLRNPSNRLVAILGLATDQIVALALAFTYASDARTYINLFLVPPQLEAVVVLGLARGLGLWAATTLVYLIKEQFAVAVHDIRLDPLDSAVRVSFSLAAAVAAGLAAARLRHERIWFRRLLHAPTDAMLIVDDGAVIVDANPDAEQLFGYAIHDLRGRSVHGLVPPDHRASHGRHVEAFLQEPLRRPMSERADLEAMHRSGSTFPVEISLSPLGGGLVAVGIRNLTESRRRARHQRAWDDRYQLMLHNMQEVAYILDTSDPASPVPHLVSEGVQALTGRSPQDFYEDPQLWSSLVHPDDVPDALAAYADMLSTGRPSVRRYRVLDTSSGTYRTVEDRSVPEADENGVVRTVFGVARDVTASEDVGATAESESRYRSLVESLRGVVFRQEYGGAERPLYMSPRAIDILGYPAAELVLNADLFHGLVHFEDRARVAAEALAAREADTPFDCEYRAVQPDGSLVWVRETSALIRAGDDRPLYRQGYIVDITARKQAQRELEESYAQLRKVADNRRQLARQVVEAHEDARRRLAHDLHDDAVQKLVAVVLRLEMMAQEEPDADRRGQVEQLIASTRAASASLRSQVFELQPPALEREGLEAALREGLERFETETGVTSRLTSNLASEPSEVVRSFVYRIVQELLANVRAHAGASNLQVDLQVTEDVVTVAVNDDGVGFDPSAADTSRPGHLGLPSARGRVEAAGGTFTLRSAPGEGTTVTLEVPRSF